VSSPATTSIEQAMAAIAAQLELELSPVIDGIQVDGKLVSNPTPPCIDIYPGDPFLERSTFGPGGGYEALLTIRARVTTADQQDGQALLLELLDPRGPASLLAALETDATFAGTVDDSTVESVSGFLPYEAPSAAGGGVSGALLGAEWRLRVAL
jgi:hypothetical protein